MFPYESWWRWYLGGRQAHLIEATEDHLDAFQEPYRTILQERAKRMRWGLGVRAFFLVLLNLGLIAAGVAWLASVIPALAELGQSLRRVASVAGASTLLITGLILLASRYLGQLEADMLASMALGTPGLPGATEEERRRIQEQEEAGDPPWRPITERTRRKR